MLPEAILEEGPRPVLVEVLPVEDPVAVEQGNEPVEIKDARLAYLQ